MGKILHSDKSCAQIAIHIATEMRKAVCKEIITSKKKIAILIDESTTLSKKATLVIAIRTFFGDYPGEAYVFYLDLIELPNTSAKTITDELLKCLSAHGFHQDFLKECLISFACDGASVMLGKESGVATRLRELHPNLLVWHCANHRLELGVNDAIKEVSGINHFKIFIEKLYILYSKSPKNHNELREAATSLDMQLLRIGKKFSVRWVASSYRTVNAVINNYPALCEHFHRASKDNDRDDLERKKYKGLWSFVTSEEFVLNLNIMADALEELADLSQYLQRRNITVVDADKAITTTIRVLDSMASDPGKKLCATLTDLESNTYKGVTLHKNKSIKSINASQLYRSLANNIRQRLITTVSSHVSRNEKKQVENMSIYNNLIQSVKLLCHKKRDLENDIRYGEDQIRQLCHQFHLNDKDIIRGLRIFKINEEDDDTPEDLKPLLKAISTIPISTSESERNFSSMNEIVSPIRSSLNIETISALMFINIIGPPLTQFQPSKYVRSWLAKGHRPADYFARRKIENRVEKTYEHLWKLL